jgi:hypothetical protein
MQEIVVPEAIANIMALQAEPKLKENKNISGA